MPAYVQAELDRWGVFVRETGIERTEAMLCQAASNPPIAMLLSYGASQPDAYRQAAAQQAGNSAAA